MGKETIKLKKIYELKCPGNESYIGQTHKKLEDRWRKGKAYRPNSKVGKAIAKYGWDNIEKNVLYVDLTPEEADYIEVKEIEKRGGINHPLVLNGQSGGHKGYTLSDFNLNVQSDLMKKYYKEHPEFAKEKSKSSKKYYYEDHPERTIKVDQYSYDGKEFIASYESAIEAQRQTGVNRNGISKCITGEHDSAGGFRWVKQGKKLGIIQYKTRDNNIVVNQIDSNTGEIIATYHSISKASYATGIDKRSISDAVNNPGKHAGGYKWEKG